MPSTVVNAEPRKKAVLKYQGRELFLASGRYVIGRAPNSDIVMRTRLASRQHARLIVSADIVTIEDMGSANGVRVNGNRIQETCTLSVGDRIAIGGEEFEFRDFSFNPELARPPPEQDTWRESMKPGASIETGPAGSDSTVQHDGFELAGSMAQRALASHRLHDAVDILRYRLARVLDSVKRGQAVPLRIRDAAIDYGCKLAIATHDGKWIEYVLELLIAQSLPCPESHTDALRQSVESVTSMNGELLERYARTLRALPPNLDHTRAIQHADTLIRLFQNKR
jgi:hypothetical protein